MNTSLRPDAFDEDSAADDRDQIDRPCDSEARRRKFMWRFWIGGMLLACLLLPAIRDSGRALGTLRNLPALWLPESLPIRQEFFTFIDTFGLTDLVMVSWDDAVLHDSKLDLANDFLTQLCPNADETAVDRNVQRLVDQVRESVGSDFPLDWVDNGSAMVDRLQRPPLSASENSARRRLAGSLVGRENNQTCLLLSLAASESSQHRRLIPAIRVALASLLSIAPENVRLVGGPVDGVAVDRESIRSIERFSLPAMAIAAVLCFVCLGSFPLTLVIVAVAMIGQGLVLAGIYYAGIDISAVLIVLPPLVLVLTISSGIHLSHYYLDALHHLDPLQHQNIASRVDAAMTAMQRGVLPCLIATGTTMIGLLSLLLVRLQPVYVFGIAGSIALISTLGVLILMLPGAMILTGPRRGFAAGQTTTSLRLRADAKIAAVLKRWGLIIAGFAVISIVAAIGLTRLTTAVSVPAMFRQDSQLRSDYQWFEAKLGPTMSGDILVRWTTDDIGSQRRQISSDETLDQNAVDWIDQARIMTKIHAELAAEDGVDGILSAATFLPPIPTARDWSAAGRRNVIRRALADPDSIVRQSGYLSKDGTWRLSFRFYQSGHSDFGERLDRVDAVVKRVLAPEPVNASVTGHVVIVQRTQEILLRDLFKSFLAAFVVIFVIMVWLTGSVVTGMLAMIPNLIPTLILFGGLGWSKTPLDIGSVMTASVALGIAVDDTVHFLSRYAVHLQKSGRAPTAAARTVAQCGPAMIHTTLVCGVSLLAYAASDFLPTQRFALFMFLLLAAALAGVMLLLPSLLILRSRWGGGDAIES